MVDKQSPRRVLVARYVAVACATVGLLTLVVPDWIEALTGYHPDKHSGAVEATIVVALFVVALVTGGYSLVVTRRTASGHVSD